MKFVFHFTFLFFVFRCLLGSLSDVDSELFVREIPNVDLSVYLYDK